MEEINLANNKIYKGNVYSSEMSYIKEKIIRFFENNRHEQKYFRTPYNVNSPLSGPGYQFFPSDLGNEYKVLSKIICDRMSQIVDKQIFILDSWVLLQSNENWIDNQPHEHLTSDWIGVLYLQTNESDSITFLDDAGNEETLEVSDNLLLLFPNYVKHKPNRTTESKYRISFNFDLVYEYTEEEIVTNQTRIAICETCEEYNEFKFCNQCKCFMPLKARIPFTTCPLGKW